MDIETIGQKFEETWLKTLFLNLGLSLILSLPLEVPISKDLPS